MLPYPAVRNSGTMGPVNLLGKSRREELCKMTRWTGNPHRHPVQHGLQHRVGALSRLSFPVLVQTYPQIFDADPMPATGWGVPWRGTWRRAALWEFRVPTFCRTCPESPSEIAQPTPAGRDEAGKWGALGPPIARPPARSPPPMERPRQAVQADRVASWDTRVGHVDLEDGDGS